jgi:hypothetical protein
MKNVLSQRNQCQRGGNWNRKRPDLYMDGFICEVLEEDEIQAKIHTIGVVETVVHVNKNFKDYGS